MTGKQLGKLITAISEKYNDDYITDYAIDIIIENLPYDLNELRAILSDNQDIYIENKKDHIYFEFFNKMELEINEDRTDLKNNYMVLDKINKKY